VATVRTAQYPRIVRNKRILGGAPVIRGTRVPVRAIAFLWRATGDRARIRRDYPHLTVADVDDAIRFYEAHRLQIDTDLLDEQDGED
jgi:uncharacterized protein (DUF433 family)